MRTILAFFVGAIVGAAGLWYLGTSQGRSKAQATGAQIETAAKSVHDALDEKLRDLKLNPQDVKDELARTGQVVRRKAQQAGQTIADATADTRLTAAIKAKILVNRDLSSHDISVSTTGGIVTLSGGVDSPEDISKAMLLAMETEGVREVVSKLQVSRQPDSK
jgi:osmotically-inducible protein OsmY